MQRAAPSRRGSCRAARGRIAAPARAQRVGERVTEHRAPSEAGARPISERGVSSDAAKAGSVHGHCALTASTRPRCAKFLPRSSTRARQPGPSAVGPCQRNSLHETCRRASVRPIRDVARVRMHTASSGAASNSSASVSGTAPPSSDPRSPPPPRGSRRCVRGRGSPRRHGPRISRDEGAEPLTRPPGADADPQRVHLPAP